MNKCIKALAYARVSTSDQAESDLSIPAQLKEIRIYAEKNDIEIVEEYKDEGISAFSDEGKRLSFNAMIQHATNDKSISLILVHDISRFFRNKYKSSAIKADLAIHGVTVISTTSPYDPRTIDGTWRESIEETLAQTTSMQISFHTIKGMKENAEKRDPETGYCYKNGGRAPYGYTLKQIPAGKDKKGKLKTKLLWEINPETSKVLRKIVVDWRIGEGLSYKKIRDKLNSLNIPGPEGKPWGTSTLAEMLKENRLMQYTGIYYWNKEDHKTPGKRFKDKSEWIEVQNAHPLILTIEEVKACLSITKSRQPGTAAARSYNSPWLLTGLNIESKPFFTCKKCGRNMIGISSGKNYGTYRCGTYHNKGNAGCTNKARINRFVLEKKLLDEIEINFGTPYAIKSLVAELNKRLSNELNVFNAALERKNKELNGIEKDIEMTFTAFSKGLDPDICNERLLIFKTKRLEAKNIIEGMEKNKPQPVNIDPAKAQELFNNLKQIYDSGSNEQKRTLYKTYIRRMEFDPDKNHLNIVFYPNYVQEKVKREDFSPRYISGGVGRGT